MSIRPAGLIERYERVVFQLPWLRIESGYARQPASRTVAKNEMRLRKGATRDG
jgi:hypothetical protein